MNETTIKITEELLATIHSILLAKPYAEVHMLCKAIEHAVGVAHSTKEIPLIPISAINDITDYMGATYTYSEVSELLQLLSAELAKGKLRLEMELEEDAKDTDRRKEDAKDTDKEE